MEMALAPTVPNFYVSPLPMRSPALLLSRRFHWLLVLLLGAAGALNAAPAPAWISLFDGETLKGWKAVGGHARYEVRDGAIVGTIVADKVGSFLITEAEFGDFVLECEFRAEWGLNSGLQFRAAFPSNYPEARMLGYQYEIDPTDRAITGALNAEIPGRKGHGLSPVTHSGPARDAWVKARDNGAWFKRDEWNSLRIECRGSHLKLWLNGHVTVEWDNSSRARGFFGLQVPQAPEQSPLIGKKVWFRNLRLQRLD